MIKVLLRVEEDLFEDRMKSQAFTKALAEWHEFPWVKYLMEHAERPYKVEDYKDFSSYSRTYITYWQLPPDKETYFYLMWGDQIGR